MNLASPHPLLPTADEVRSAAEAIGDLALHTPLLQVEHRGVAARLKPECLQATGSFKIRGAAAAIAADTHTGPLVTVSAGNMGRAVAYLGSRLGRETIVVVPDHAPTAKLDPIAALGGTIRKVTFAEWWSIVESGQSPVEDAVFIHPFANRHVIAGNATIALELADEDDVDAVLVPWGGGGLASGIAHGLNLFRPGTPVYAVETSTSAALTAAFEAERPVQIDYAPTFIDGIGSPEVSAEMWPLAQQLIAGTIVVTEDEAKAGLRSAAQHTRIIVEGAGACAVAALADPRLAGKNLVAVASGSNINLEKVTQILTESQA